MNNAPASAASMSAQTTCQHRALTLATKAKDAEREAAIQARTGDFTGAFWHIRQASSHWGHSVFFALAAANPETAEAALAADEAHVCGQPNAAKLQDQAAKKAAAFIREMQSRPYEIMEPTTAQDGARGILNRKQRRA